LQRHTSLYIEMMTDTVRLQPMGHGELDEFNRAVHAVL